MSAESSNFRSLSSQTLKGDGVASGAFWWTLKILTFQGAKHVLAINEIWGKFQPESTPKNGETSRDWTHVIPSTT